MDTGREAGALRDVLACFPTGVVAVCAMCDGRPAGLAVGSFLSLSLDPPLVGFGVAHTSTSWPSIACLPSFAVSILAADQDDISKTIATPGGDKFASVPWHLSRGGSPVISGAVAYLDCTHHARHRTGDHDLIVGLVQHYALLEITPPLVFHRRQYSQPGSGPTAR